MRVGVPSFGGLEARIQPYHQEHKTWPDTVNEVVDRRVRVARAACLAGFAAFC